MPTGMASLLTAPLVADGAVEDSVSLNLAFFNFKYLSCYAKKQPSPPWSANRASVTLFIRNAVLRLCK